MAGIRDANVELSYAGKGSEILHKFLLPLLEEASSYDRITSFFTVESLQAIAWGLQSIWERKGHVRIIMGVHSVPEEIITASCASDALRPEIDRIGREVSDGLANISDELARSRVATIAWMIQDGLLSVKAVAIPNGGIFHPKTLIISDGIDTVVAVGSPNETGSGLGDNFEQILCASSWDNPRGVARQSEFFESLWNDSLPGAIVCDISEDIEAAVSAALGDDVRRPQLSDDASADSIDVLHAARSMPLSFFYSGAIPGLYQHQERAVIDALSRWPIRVLLADEVGLGKTFEAAATITFLVRYCKVKRVVILTPKAVLKQWQDELIEHFGIEAWLYDSAARCYVSPSGEKRDMRGRAVLGRSCPQICLMSAQFARGGGKRKDVFAEEGALLPDLLVVDEAHAARVSTSIDGKRTETLLHKMLSRVAPCIPHIILATATPMQKEPGEYHAMLGLLGLPKPWRNPKSFVRSLELIETKEPPTLDDASLVARLLGSVIDTMEPDFSILNKETLSAIYGFIQLRARKTPLFVQADYVMREWDAFQNALVLLHPSSLLTVRNTRRSLEAIGYIFPKRNLKPISVEQSEAQVLFNMDVIKYLDEECFSTERELRSGHKLNIGFVRNQYMQRTASSLTSCHRTLKRRRKKIKEIFNVARDGSLTLDWALQQSSSALDDIEEDELLEIGGEADEKAIELDLSRIEQAAGIELFSLDALVTRASALLDSEGDGKIAAAIRVACKHIAEGDRVLVFSRYTDTVDALIEEYLSYEDEVPPFGVYDGSRSLIIDDEAERQVDKNEIKSALQSGEIAVMFCSDAASEGLNLQAARVLINVDVPWTPSRLEQRIGRVARLGQKASSVDIYNIWYPSSIEAIMYERIQSRLDSLNLAIGEFPDVVADSIRNAVIADGPDTSLEQLQSLRGSVQMQALDRLWYSKRDGVTESEQVRTHLLDLVKGRLSWRDLGFGRIEAELPGGEKEALTCEIGAGELISLSSASIMAISKPRSDVEIGYSEDGTPEAFVQKGSLSHWAMNAEVFSVHDGSLAFRDVQNSRPTSLPDVSRLDMSFAYEGGSLARPQLWPPKGASN